MTFYVKKDGSAEIEGPFTIEQINQMAKEMRLTADSLAILNKNQIPEDLKVIPLKEWFRLDVIQGFIPASRKEGCCLPVVVVLLFILAGILIAVLLEFSNVMKGIH